MRKSYQRIKKLRTAWNMRKNATEVDLGKINRELLKTTDVIDAVTINIGSNESIVHRYQDFSFRFLVGMVDLKNKVLEEQKRLHSKLMIESRNEKMCELIEDKLKVEIETTQSAADLTATLELLVSSKNISE